VLAALAGGEAMTAGPVADKTSLARPTVSTTLSKLAKTGEVQKAARGRGGEPIYSVAAAYIEDGGEFLVGICDGRLVAMAAPRHVTDAVAELNRMRVHPGFQRRGFGRTILAHLEHRAGELGYRTLRLDTAVTLTAAQRLYESAGYREVGRGQLAGAEVIYFEKTLR
jgi:ribosomal protein S18 acetylase RimI-like enzyme